MLDIHSKIAAIIHIVLGVLSLFLLACLALFFRALAHVIHDVPVVHDVITRIGPIILGVLVAFSLLEMVAAAAFLNGSRAARTVLVIYSVVALFNVPIGTAAGGYSLWALLRK
jgi:hypothetical protein